jgi:carboxymethylenebutenolidase
MEFTSGKATVHTMDTDITIPSESGAVMAHLALPEGSGKYPCLVLIEEIWGVNEHIKDLANRFAKEGFIVLAPELLPEGLLEQLTPDLMAGLFDPEKRNEVQPKLRAAMQPIQQPDYAKATVAKLKACMDYLIAHAQSNGKVGSLGFCFGGTYSLQLAINDPRLDACVVFYGHAPDPIDQVANIGCPVLDMYGEKDANIVSSMPALEAAMKEHGKDFQAICYPGVGHAFFNDTNPRAYDEHSASDAWNKSLSFLHKYLEA